MDATDVLDSMKRMEWQHAKGHLLAMLETYRPVWITVSKKEDNGFERMNESVNAFIKDVEDHL
jgi:hypothetical protein